MVKILVVDDEIETTQIYCRVLRRIKNVESFGAVNAKEAFENLESQKPDLLLLDLNLNETLTGIDVLKKGRELNPAIQALIITGNGEETVHKECLALGARKIIEKPVDLQMLLETVKKVVNEIAASKGE